MTFIFKSRVGIKVSTHKTQGEFCLSFGLFTWYLWLDPWLVPLGSHRPSNLVTSVPLKGVEL